MKGRREEEIRGGISLRGKEEEMNTKRQEEGINIERDKVWISDGEKRRVRKRWYRFVRRGRGGRDEY